MSKIKKKSKELFVYLNLIKDKLSHHKCVHNACKDLSFQELTTINHLGTLNDCCIMRKLAEHLRLAVSTVTGIVDKLVNKNVVTRERVDEDRRIVQVKLTAKGKEIYDVETENFMHLSEDMLKVLTDEEQDILLALLRKIISKNKFNN